MRRVSSDWQVWWCWVGGAAGRWGRSKVGGGRVVPRRRALVFRPQRVRSTDGPEDRLPRKPLPGSFVIADRGRRLVDLTRAATAQGCEECIWNLAESPLRAPQKRELVASRFTLQGHLSPHAGKSGPFPPHGGRGTDTRRSKPRAGLFDSAKAGTKSLPASAAGAGVSFFSPSFKCPLDFRRARANGVRSHRGSETCLFLGARFTRTKSMPPTLAVGERMDSGLYS